MQQEQVATAWRARGIYNKMSSQLQAAVSARNSAVEELAEVTQALDVTSSSEAHIQPLSLIASNVQVSENHSQLLVAALEERDNALQELEQIQDTERRLTREYEQRLQQAFEEHQQRYQQELEEQIQQERQIILVQMEETTHQRLQELKCDHDLHQSEMRRAEEEHQQQAVELTRTCEELENRIQELEQMRTQVSVNCMQMIQIS